MGTRGIRVVKQKLGWERGIRVGMLGIRVGMRAMGVREREIRRIRV